MPTAHRVLVAPHAAADMYALVDDIAAYPRFLPWCEGADVRRDGERVTATLRVCHRGFRAAFSTVNTHTPTSRIQMRLKEGPLSSLSGEWRFSPLDDSRCRIEFSLRYEFQNRLLGGAFAAVFAFVFDRFAERFVERAAAMHGERAAARLSP